MAVVALVAAVASVIVATAKGCSGPDNRDLPKAALSDSTDKVSKTNQNELLLFL